MTEDDNLFINYELIPDLGLIPCKIRGRMGQEEAASARPRRLPPRAGAKSPQRNGREKCALRLARARNQAREPRRRKRGHARMRYARNRDAPQAGRRRRERNETRWRKDMQDGDKRRFGEAGGDGRGAAEHDKT